MTNNDHLFPALAPARRQLDLSGSIVPNAVGMTHAAILFEQFTTISPRNDGVDNDNDATPDNQGEQFVRGQININTAPLHILTLGAPLNESPTQTEALMRAIAHYRDMPSDRTAMNAQGISGVRAQPGIASIGELLHLTSTTFAYPPDAVDMTANTARIDGYTAFTPAAFTTSDYDLYPLPENTAAQRLPSQQDGNEQKLARLQFLSQAFNTRSDTFTAFVRLRGYPAADFSKGEVESRNFLVVFDRSNIVTPNDMPRIVGVYVYNVP